MQAEVDQLSAGICRIGKWTFLPGGNELRCGDERRRLEFRTARTLELLCRRRGAVVSQDEIRREVWNGRAISPNSVPVVIKDLRQALGDDARRPRYIETVAKRGYQLLSGPEAGWVNAGPEEAAKRQRPRPLIMFGLPLVLLLAALIAWAATREERPAPVPLIVTEVENATGSARHEPLASATNEVIMGKAQRLRGVDVFRGNGRQRPAGSITLGTRLVMWNGTPTVMMSAQDESGAVIWTGMTWGDEPAIPGEVSAALDELGQKMALQ